MVQGLNCCIKFLFAFSRRVFVNEGVLYASLRSDTSVSIRFLAKGLRQLLDDELELQSHPMFLFAFSRRVFVNSSPPSVCTWCPVSIRFLAKGLRQLYVIRHDDGRMMVSIRFLAKGLRQQL